MKTIWRNVAQTFQADLVIVGADDAGLRATIAAAQANPNAKIVLISKIYPMRSHTVVAEGGPTAVAQDHDSFEYHFHDTVADGNWSCKQDIVDYFVHHCPTETTRLELWGCPQSRRPDGNVSVRRFGGMKIEHAWFAADKTGFRILHTLFRTSLQFPQVQRFDEHFVLDILIDDGHIHGLVTMNMMEGTPMQVRTSTAVMITGGASRIYCYNTNGGIITDDSTGMALSHGVPLRDIEFIQHHLTGLSDSSILMTEDCRGEGSVLVNENGYRYLQDYGMGPETPLGEPRNKYMELGSHNKVSQAFWHEWRKDNTISTPRGDVVYLDLRHLDEKKLYEHLPFICELAKAYVDIDPVKEPIPVRPATHYTMDDIETDQNCETRIKGLFAVGECSSVGLHDANRLGFNFLAELVVFGRLADKQATKHAATAGNGNEAAIGAQAASVEQRLRNLVNQDGGENWAKIRGKVGLAMEEGCGIYRTPGLMQRTISKLAELQGRFKRVRITNTSSVFNTDLLYIIELGHDLSVAECVTHFAMARRESRGAHQRLDEGYAERGGVNFLRHALAFHDAGDTTRLEYSDVKITTLPPTKRVYSDEADATDKAETANKKERANGRDEKPGNRGGAL